MLPPDELGVNSCDDVTTASCVGEHSYVTDELGTSSYGNVTTACFLSEHSYAADNPLVKCIDCCDKCVDCIYLIKSITVEINRLRKANADLLLQNDELQQKLSFRAGFSWWEAWDPA